MYIFFNTLNCSFWADDINFQVCLFGGYQFCILCFKVNCLRKCFYVQFVELGRLAPFEMGSRPRL